MHPDESNELISALANLTQTIKNGFEGLKSYLELATKQDLKETEKRIMALIDDVLADVQDESTVEDSVLALLTSVSAQLAAAGTDPVKLQAVKTLIDSNKAKMAAAVVAGTPAAPTPPPAA